MPDPPRRYDPRSHEPDDATPYGLGDDPPPPEPESSPDMGEGPKSRKKPRPADYRRLKVDPRYQDRLLKPRRKRPKTEWPWWLFPLAFALAGFWLGAIPVARALDRVKTGVTTGLLILIVLAVAVIAQTGAYWATLGVLGGQFGIDYGPTRRTLPKLAGLAAFVTGLAIAMMSLGGPLMLVPAAVPVLAAFAAMFKLDLVDLAVTAIGLVTGAAGVVVLVGGGAVVLFG